MSEDSSHAGSTEQHGPQGLVDDIRKHRTNGQESEICLLKGTRKKKGQSQMGEREHSRWLGLIEYKMIGFRRSACVILDLDNDIKLNSSKNFWFRKLLIIDPFFKKP